MHIAKNGSHSISPEHNAKRSIYSTTANMSSVTTTTSAPPSTSTIPVCNKEEMSSTFNTSTSQGPLCGFPLLPKIDFTSCCAPNQKIQYTDVCTQFCVVNKNETENEFDACVSVLVAAQNQTLGILGCQGLESDQKSGSVRVERGFMVWLTVAVLLSGVLLS